MLVLLFASIAPHLSNPESVVEGAQMEALGVAMVALGTTVFAHNNTEQLGSWGLEAAFALLQRSSLWATIETMIGGAAVGNETEASAAVSGVTQRGLQIAAALFAIELEEDFFR